MIEVFAEHGMIGLVGVLFAAQMVFLHKTLMGKLTEIEQITIKLIDRWNKSDEKAERRHEKQIGQMNYLTDDVNFLKGRINGGQRG
jgi:ABC-type polar amino acid transport system ATPase subunit